ncbi:HNH endonuclease family protein [Streptomyces sp. NPDC020362]|uniref:HNH endonuclease family protein n=1 Tax=unclassified Streptomyces TaxID=2593676 RepID=UPI0033F0D19A
MEWYGSPAEAWDSGADGWTAMEREAYANDLGDDRELIAVSAATNRSKTDQDPSTWLSPGIGYRCQYVTDWVADKIRWGLSIGPVEQSALADLLDSCPDIPIAVIQAR